MSPVVAATRQEIELVRAFEENAFDLAGLADLTVDSDTVDAALRELHLILINGSQPRPSSRPRLARVLLAMLVVARDNYAASGHQEYWPFLFERIETVGKHLLTNSRITFRGQHQSLLGQWFKLALDTFGYSVPDGGQSLIGPVVFHAGIPNKSLSGALHLIEAAVQHYGEQAVNLSVELRSKLAKNTQPPLHRNVERLLTSRLRGATQLWNCLARVVLAWQWRGDCTEELRQLPAALDPEAVRQALLGNKEASRRNRVALPHIRFDVSSGTVRLIVPLGDSNTWRVSSEGRSLDVRWTRTHLGMTAEFLQPLPEEISIAHAGGDLRFGRRIASRPSDWPGIWFHAANGCIEDAASIDANGLEPGRWFVLFEGTPTNWNIPAVFRLPLKWSWFAGGEQWTAWEIEVPPRSPDQASLEWYVGDNSFHIPLARRPGVRVENTTRPVTLASTASGHAVSVFSIAPRVRLRRDRCLSVVLLHETITNLDILQRVELSPNQEWQIPVDEPGIYQLREARGIGRILLHFAVIPALKIEGPIYDARKEQVTLRIASTVDAGQPFAVGGKPIADANGAFQVEQSTIKPTIGFEWHWRSADIPSLWFEWNVEGLRWRVLRLSDEAARWTREPIFVTPTDVTKRDAKLEIQIPKDTELRINDRDFSSRLTHGAIGSSFTIDLLPFDELVELGFADEDPRPAVVISDRPIIEHIEAKLDGDAIHVSWNGKVSQPGAIVVAWDPCNPRASPRLIPLTDEQLAKHACRIPCSDVSGDWTSLCIARSIRIGFSRQILQLGAAASRHMTRPTALLLCRTKRRCSSPNADAPASWVEFLHNLSLDLLNGHPGDPNRISKSLLDLSTNGGVDLNDVIALLATIPSCEPGQLTSAAGEAQWGSNIKQAMTGYLRQQLQRNPSQIFCRSSQFLPTDTLDKLLQVGVPLGQTCPFQWLSVDVPLDLSACAYPFSFICDLWVLGSCEAHSSQQLQVDGQRLRGFQEQQRIAAIRVWKFLESRGLLFLGKLLPMAQKTAQALNTDRGHNHSFALPQRSLSTASDFADALGLDDLGLDCHAASDDLFWDDERGREKGVWYSRAARKALGLPPAEERRDPNYSLFWCRSEGKWYFERPSMSPEISCCASQTPLTVAPISFGKLIDGTNLRQVLSGWKVPLATIDKVACSPDLLQLLIDRLCAHSKLGALHNEIATAPRIEMQELFGKSVAVATKFALAEPTRIAWQLAWVDRLSAWEGPKYFFGDEPSTGGQHADFLRALGRACVAWPRLMERSIALAEFLIWIFCRGGIGNALRFSGDRGNSLLHSSQQSAATLEVRSATSHNRDVFNSEDALVSGATGVIVGFGGRNGFIVVKHPKSPSLATTVQCYLESRRSCERWLAQFDWHAIDKSDRKQVLDYFSRLSNRGKARTLEDILCGMVVRCDLRLAARWTSTSIRIAFDSKPFTIPSFRRTRKRK